LSPLPQDATVEDEGHALLAYAEQISMTHMKKLLVIEKSSGVKVFVSKIEMSTMSSNRNEEEMESKENAVQEIVTSTDHS